MKDLSRLGSWRTSLSQRLVCRRYLGVSTCGQRGKQDPAEGKGNAARSQQGFSQAKALSGRKDPSECSCIGHQHSLRPEEDTTLGERFSSGKGKSPGAGSSQHLGAKWASGPGCGASPTGVNNDPHRASKILLCERLKWEAEEPGVGRQVYRSVRDQVRKLVRPSEPPGPCPS